jgi:cystathionine beta-lyase/cystathionine gamma-synthase
VLVCDDVYGGTGRLFRRLFAKYNIDFQFIDMSDLDLVRRSATPNTKMVWVESPTNPTMKVIDIKAMSQIAKSVGARLVVDNTFASPVFQSPMLLGADVVMHSSTKYIGGHSDMIGGALMMADKELFEQLKFVQFAAGAVPSPFESFLFLRSIKTLAVRMEQHAKNSQAVAEFLERHKKIKKVYYPGLKSHPQHALAKEQMSGFSGMVSFDLNGSYDDVVRFVKGLKVFALAESLGGVESLINHPEKMTHASVPEELRRKLGIGPTLLRLSVGIEDVTDLIADLEQALNAL